MISFTFCRRFSGSLLAGVLVLAVCGQGYPDQPTRFVRFQAGDAVRYGLVEGDTVRVISGTPFGNWQATDQTFPLNELKILIPCEPTKVIALAGNYRDHLGDQPVPEHPEPFYKLPSCLVPHEANVVQPSDHPPVHYEAEMVVVIGKRARNVSEAEALDYVLGVTCGNDISARDWQQNDRQWWRAKGSDTFGPVGPFIAKGLDYNNLNLQLRVNGEVRQTTNTKNQIHNVAQTVSFISRYVTLEPGDLIYTGTPGMTQPLAVGDVVEVELEGVGVLRNRLVAAEEQK